MTTLVNNLLSQFRNLNVNENYGQSAAVGYVLQALAEFLWAGRDYVIPRRDELIEAGIAEIVELQLAANEVIGDGPAFGLVDAWDAFGDGTVNPAMTAYTWQSGMAVLGVAKLARFLVETEHPSAAVVRDFGVELVEYWRPTTPR